MIIKQIEGENILLRYKDIKKELDRALEHSDGEWTAIQIVQNAVANPSMFQIWEIQNGNHWIGIASTRVIEYMNFTSLHIITLGGKEIKNHFEELILIFEDMIKKYPGIDLLEYTGRRGFVKQLTKVGWEEKYTTMRKQLKENLDV